MIYAIGLALIAAAYFLGNIVGWTRGRDDTIEAIRYGIAEQSPYNLEGQRKAARERRN